MKTIIFALVIAVLAFAGCSNNQKSTEGTHEHGDGTTHTHENGDAHQNHDSVLQQEFKVDQDSVIHEHAGDSTHNHAH